MYTSELFLNTSNTIDGYAGLRTVHLGVDLGAPGRQPFQRDSFLVLCDSRILIFNVLFSTQSLVGTKVYAFSDGIVHSAGYNEDFGDYGYVVVIEHHLPAKDDEPPRTLWALYGHMDKGSVRSKKPGRVVKKGKMIGRVGDCHENGGWVAPHLHFQLSLKPPETHDMPGASSMRDRKSALKDYPDPRYVLGAVH